MIRLSVIGAALAMLVVVMPHSGTAQTQITPDEFLDRAVGHTLTFSGHDDGHLIGIEQFLRRDLSVWVPSSGRCSYGRIDIRGPLLCFLYEDYPNPDNCWMPFEDEQGLVVMSSSSYQLQRITRIDTKPVSCKEAPLS